MLEVLLVILVFSLNFVLLHGEGSPVSAGLNSMILLSDYIDRIRSSCRPETDDSLRFFRGSVEFSKFV